jgi:MFS family permease
VLFVSVMMATTEPTPLYAFWERSYTFGPIVTTLVLATYAIGVIAALLFAGRDSDVDGRRPVLLACVALSALSSVLFLLADGLPMLFAARLVSGFSAGLVSPTATATLVDLAGTGPLWSKVVPGVVNLLGLGLGPIMGGVLADPERRASRRRVVSGRDPRWLQPGGRSDQCPRAIHSCRWGASAPIVVSDPWPVWTIVSGARTSSRSRIEPMMAPKSENERPVAPGPPANKVSPLNSQPWPGR